MNFTIEIPQVSTKPLNKNEKRWMIQREIFDLLETQKELKMCNWKKYRKWLLQTKTNENEKGRLRTWEQWRQKRNLGPLQYVREISKSSLGFFTSHLDEEALWYVLSVVKDKRQRGETVTPYIYSLVKFTNNT